MRAWLRASAVGIRWGIRPALWWFGDSSQECFGSRIFTDPWLNMNDKGQSFTTSDKEHSRRQWCVSSGGCRFEGSVRGTGPLPPVPSVRRRQLGHEGAGRRGPPRPARARRPPRRSVGRTATVAGGAALAEAIPAEDPGEGPLPSPGPGGTLGCPILQPPPLRHPYFITHPMRSDHEKLHKPFFIRIFMSMRQIFSRQRARHRHRWSTCMPTRSPRSPLWRPRGPRRS